ncbi:hypothetical protein SNE40_013050 [Patella caerulea]|uniref:Zinc finger PHD-type domain-containing protein n=1 Tax=Patella caerulea TaxID=87958 RepID=A0AAN8PGF2_PATCE
MNIEELEVPDNFPTSKDEQLQYLYDIVNKIIDMVYVSSQPIVKQIIENKDAESATIDVYYYCICKLDIPGSKMIYCENRNCKRGIWFHYECVDLEEENVPEGLWFCSPACEKEKAKRKSKKKVCVADSLLDRKGLYVSKVIWSGLNQKVRRDAIRENDGERIILHWKMDLLQFFEKHHPKYFLIGFRLLASINGAVSTRLQHTLKWNRCVNVNGRAGNNIAMDLQMEYYNKEYKGTVFLINSIEIPFF